MGVILADVIGRAAVLLLVIAFPKLATALL